MPDQNGANSTGSLNGNYSRRAGAFNHGTSEITFSVSLPGLPAPQARTTDVQGLITWSFIATPKLELVDMYCDLV